MTLGYYDFVVVGKLSKTGTSNSFATKSGTFYVGTVSQLG